MFKVEDIGLLVKNVSEKKLKSALNIKNMEFDEISSNKIDPEGYTYITKYCFEIYFKIKQTVNKEELSKMILEIITHELAKKLDLYYKRKYYNEYFINESVQINDLVVLNKSKSSVGIRGNVNYFKFKIDITPSWCENIDHKIKSLIRNIKMSQLRI